MIIHKIEVGRKENSDTIRVSIITDAAGFSISLVFVGVETVISSVSGWFGIILVIEHTDAGATCVGSVGVPFDAKSMRGIT